jgi:signal transduction histidine kinase
MHIEQRLDAVATLLEDALAEVRRAIDGIQAEELGRNAGSMPGDNKEPR